MMSTFLSDHHDDLVSRCRSKVMKRPRSDPSSIQLINGVPTFLNQLQRTLEVEDDKRMRFPGTSAGGDTVLLSEIAATAAAHGHALLDLGFSVDQVVHDYSDLCQAITDLAAESEALFSVPEFRTLNQCLDNAIASAVSAFCHQRDTHIAYRVNVELNERIGLLVHELRNALSTASYATEALELGNLPMSGSTGTVLKRSLERLNEIISDSFERVQGKGMEPAISLSRRHH